MRPILCTVLFLALATGAHAQERKLSRKALPAPVLAAFQKAYPKAVIKAAAEETQNGVTTFEIESLDGKVARDLQYQADGTLVEIEETLALSEVPEAVKAAAAAKYPQGKLLKAEKVTKGAVTSYDIEIKTGRGKVSMEVDAAGKLLKEK
jgi:lactam utilization protein B